MSDALLLRHGGTVTKRSNILTSSKKILEVIILQPLHQVKDQKKKDNADYKRKYVNVEHPFAAERGRNPIARFMLLYIYFLQLFLLWFCHLDYDALSQFFVEL